jgi:hypothetical protein
MPPSSRFPDPVTSLIHSDPPDPSTMQTIPTQTAQDDETSFLLESSTFDTHGLCSDYPLRRHKSASEADAGCEALRKDWKEYVGPLKTEGSCNSIDGNVFALVLPLCKEERLRLIAYVGECECLPLYQR